MAKLGDIFKGSYLKADDLQGKTVRLLVERAEVVDFDDGAKVVLHFANKEKGMVCNKTNCAVMQEITGSDDTDDWAGAQITLAARKVEFQGKLVPALRIALPDQSPTRTAKPAPAKAAPMAPPRPAGEAYPDGGSDDVPF